MKGQFWRKALAAALALLVVSGSVPIQPLSQVFEDIAITASAETNTQILEYLATDGTLTTLNENATTVTNSTTSWSNGWYVVSTDVTIADRITVSGTVNLILCDGATLTASKGITVGSSATFNVYAQSDDEATMGALVADATNDNANWYAGIGGVENADAGMITINGGQINATGWCAAGIGSGGGTSTVGTITINGGIVTAQDNAHYGAGIGGGFNGGKASTINLNGGVIHAAGIGSGYMGGACSITVNISDGVKKIVATPVQGGACIGSGKSASGSVTVNFKSGGNVVTGDAKDAVFYDTGEGSQRQIRAKALNHAVTMSDDLKANITVNTEYAVVGETVTLTLGTAVDASTLKVNDGVSDLSLTDAGNRQYTFTMPDGDVTVTATLLQTYAVNLPANMEVVSATNAADANGKYITGTTINFKVSFPYAASDVSDGTNTLTATDGVYSVTVADADITVTATIERSSTIDLTDASGDFTAINNDVLTGSTSHTVTIADGANITLKNSTITGGIVCDGTAEITLVGTNSVTGIDYQSAGIQIGGSGTTLTIKGDGSLTAAGGSASAGIGLGRTWYNNATGGSIVIEGGTVTASGGNGIGTGTVGNGKTAHMDSIIIKGGTVNARLGKGTIYNGSTATIGTIKIYDTIDKVDASAITESVTYMHDETDVTASASTYFTIIEDGDRRVITPKDDTDYSITIADNSENGTIACAATTAKYGDKVTITATPDFGYRLSRLVVKDAQNNDVESTGNNFFMPKGNVTVSAVFEQGTHGTTEFAWGYLELDGFVTEATIYDGVTTVELQQGQSCQILKYDEYSYRKFLLDNSTSEATIPYSGGTGTFPEFGNGTNFNLNDESGFYDITMTDVGNDKWSVSILKTVPVVADIPDQTYTGSEIKPEPLVLAGSLNLTKGTDYEYSYTNNINVGTAKVTVTFKDDYASLGSVEKEFNIVKATPTVTAPTANTLTYNGGEQELVTAGSTNFGKVLYSLDDETYSEEVPKGTSAGEYTVYYKVEGSDNWNAVDAATVEVTIAESYTIKWKNGDETLETDNYVPGGATPEYNGETPTKAGEDNEVFVFNGWDSEPAAVTGDMTYTAQFIKYTKVSETLATYTSAGNSEYYTCEDGKYYILSNGEFVEVAEGSWILPELEKTEVTIKSVDINGDITSTTVYAETFTKTDYTVPASPYLDGYNFVGWTVNNRLYSTAEEVQTTVAALIEKNPQAPITVAVVYEKKVENFKVTVINGSLSEGESGDNYQVGTELIATAAPAEEGLQFDHWENNGVIASYNEVYSFHVPSKEITLTAVYSSAETEIEKVGTAFIESVTTINGNKIAFVSKVAIPEGARILKAGIVANTEANLNGAELTTDTAQFTRYNDSNCYDYLAFKYTWTKSNVSADDVWCVRSYLVYRDENGNERTIYGDLVKANLNGIIN